MKKTILLLFILMASAAVFAQQADKQAEAEKIARENARIAAAEDSAFQAARLQRASATKADKARKDSSDAARAVADKYHGADSALFVSQYGTPEEYRQQEQYKRMSAHGCRVVLAGSTPIWANELSAYIQKRGFAEQGVTGSGSSFTTTFAEKVAVGSTPQTLRVVTNTAGGRISSVTITGSFQAMADLFLFYWGSTTFKQDDINGKSNVVQRFISDKITWNWNVGAPVITVVKN
ncbi:MAG: hypothetical protein K1X81_01965 [Bacteroidia bacterium]|nr:hypothetical protein [Bacteroidia bacterium]